DYHNEFNSKEGAHQKMYESIKEKIQNKKPGEVDYPEIQKLKGLIRKGEAKAGCRYVGINDENTHFMDMPFYETGKVKKKPLGDEDIKMTVDILNRLKPHLIFAAGDLSDPHGTHRVCLQAIFKALDTIKATKEPWIYDCRVWLYRGAWQ